MLEKLGHWNLLITTGNEAHIAAKLKHIAHIWIHDNKIRKNNTFLNLTVGTEISDMSIETIKLILLTTPALNDEWYENEALNIKLIEIKKEIGL